jgi:hypothetical protein
VCRWSWSHRGSEFQRRANFQVDVHLARPVELSGRDIKSVTYKNRLIILLVFAATILLLIDWLAFHPVAVRPLLGSRLLIPVSLVLCLIPIYPLYLISRKSRPELSWGPIFMMGAMVCVFISICSYFIFHSDLGWANSVLDLGQALVCLVVVVPILRWLFRRFLHRSKPEESLRKGF